jgi:hypothetical protein
MCLVLSSDWIGVLAAFMAVTSALRLRYLPAEKVLGACSTSLLSGEIKGGNRVL